jgi:hypothetical protein
MQLGADQQYFSFSQLIIIGYGVDRLLMPSLLMPGLKGKFSLGFCISFYNLHPGGGGQATNTQAA